MQLQFQEKLTQNELKEIKRIAPELQEQDILSVKATFITDDVTANNRKWTVEWQKANAEKFVGVPLLVDHENSTSNFLGRVWRSEQTGNSIIGSFFIPLNTQWGKEAKENIDSTKFKSVSINATGESKREDGIDIIYPGKNDRVFEVSFVAVGGCKSCTITESQDTKNSESCCCESKGNDKWSEYAKQIHTTLTSDFIRAAGLTVGIETFERETYQTIAESLDPESLKTITNDLRRLCEDRKEQAESANSAANQVTEVISKIKQAKGI